MSKGIRKNIYIKSSLIEKVDKLCDYLKEDDLTFSNFVEKMVLSSLKEYEKRLKNDKK